MVKKMNNSGLLSIDFIVGFTIFMIAFIAVATLISGLLVNLQSKTIDYDAVAYRTGVILVEDPGYGFVPDSQSYVSYWELIYDPFQGHPSIIRYGLENSKKEPNILSENKVSKFFNSSLFTTDEYHKKAIFDQNPNSSSLNAPPLYHFNITLRSIENQTNISSIAPSKYLYQIGEPVFDNYNFGYIRRLVKIKQPANGNNPPFDVANATRMANIPNGTYIVYFDFGKYNSTQDPSYGIDPRYENVSFTISNITSITNTTVNLLNIGFYPDYHYELTDPNSDTPIISPFTQGITIDGIPWNGNQNQSVNYNISVNLPPEFFIKNVGDPGKTILYKYYLRFDLENSGLNSEQYYNYPVNPLINGTGLNQPPLIPAVMEIKIW